MNNKLFSIFLIFTAVVCGALVMVIEVVGSRVIGPFFGISLFVWTSLIAVTMISLGGGYMIGGMLSDRTKSPDLLYTLIGLAGLLTMVIPYIKIPILKSCISLGLRGGAFAGSLVLFAPCLTILGCVSPFVIKLAIRELDRVGRTVGFYYAFSTLGSVAGTILTGFVLIVYLSVNNIFFLVGLLLIFLAAIYFLSFRRNYIVATLVLPLLAVPLMAPPAVDSKVLKDGQILQVIDKASSLYGRIKIIDKHQGSQTIRQMTIDGLLQGRIDIHNGLSLAAYAYPLQYIPRTLSPYGKQCLVIGLGTGAVPRWYMKQGVNTDVVDIDPTVVKMAVNHFDYPAGENVIIEDARYFLNKVDKKYDYIILDVFNGDVTPSYLLSKETFSLAKQHLKGNGVFAMNMIGSLNNDAVMTASVIKTVESVFDKTLIMPLFNTHKSDAIGNIIIFAYSSNVTVPEQFHVPPASIHPRARFQVSYALQNRYFPPKVPEAVILTDEYNPMDYADMAFRERIRQELLAKSDLDILLD